MTQQGGHAGLAEIYRHEVLQSRRDRSRRAFFWARIAALALMLTTLATLRSEPELRSALVGAGMDGVLMVSGRSAQVQTAARDTADPALPKSRIKVNRFGTSAPPDDPQGDAQAKANELGRTMAARKPMQ